MTVKPRESFKLKLCLWILAIATATFATVFSVCIYFIRQEVHNDLDAVVNAKLDYALRALDEGLTTTEVSAENLASISKSPLVQHRRDSIISLMKHFLNANPRIQGVCVGYEPGVVAGHEKGFAPYVMRTENGFSVLDVDTLKDYRSKEWYKVSHDTGKSHWTKPFLESNDSIIITAYTTPLYDANGKIYAVLSLDLNLNVMADSLQSLRPYPTSMLTVMDQDLRFVAHPNRDYIMNETLESLIAKADYAPNMQIIEAIKTGVRGKDTYNTNEDKVFVYYAPDPKTGWTITLEVPRQEIAKGYDKMFKTLMAIMILGILLLLAVCVYIINRITKPLENFAEAARQISHGDFDVKLPVITDHNELYDLRAALVSMKQSLNQYIADLEESTKSKATIEGELNIARNIQMAMVPKIFPPYPDRSDVDIHASLTPAKAVGGDLYDFLLDGDNFYFCIGDVSGKGVPASLFMAITRTLFRNTAAVAKAPAKIAKALNDAITEGNEENMFVTMFIGCLNLKTGELSCCNCGHNAPVINAVPTASGLAYSTRVRFMDFVPTNIPIGVMAGFDFEESVLHMAPGITLFLYTDGVTEAEDKNQQLYGDQRLLKTLRNCKPGTTAQDIISCIAQDVQSHAVDAVQSDDITMFCLRYTPSDGDE